MDTEITYSRPNTVSGLLLKHKELSRLRERHLCEAQKLSNDLASLKTVIGLFKPDHNISGLINDKPRIKRGKLKAFILDTLRESATPLNSREIADLWIEHNSLGRNDESIKNARAVIGRGLALQRKNGLIEACGHIEHKGLTKQLKAWQIIQ